MKQVAIRQLAKKTLSTTGRTLFFIAQKIDDGIFELNYPHLCQMIGIEGARRYFHHQYDRNPYAVDRLEKNGWITTRQLGDKIIIKLTQSGKIAAIQLKIANNKKPLKGKSEILLAFDIPESAKNTRKMFRESLRRMGFHRVQLSIWAINMDVAKELKQYIKLLKIHPWVTLYLANRII